MAKEVKRKKKRFSAWLSVATREKLLELAERYGTQTEVIAVAIDHLYQQERVQPMLKIKSPIDQIKTTPLQLVALLTLIADGVINATVGKAVLHEMLSTGESASTIIKRKGLTKITDEQLLRKHVRDVIEEYPILCVQYHRGQKGLLNFFIGQVMDATDDQADAQIARRLMYEELG